MHSSACRPWRMLVGVAVAAWCGTFAHGAGILAELTVEEKRAMLDAHNAQRRLWAKGGQGLKGEHPVASGILEMYWDPGLEAMAKKRASHCYYGHFGGPGAIQRDYKDVRSQLSYEWTSPVTAGENIALFKDHTKDFLESANKTTFLTNSVSGWVAEGQLFDWKRKICYADTCGHWSQVVSRFTRYVGCAVSACEDGLAGAPPQWGASAVVHCNYWPPVDGGYPYEDGLIDEYAAFCHRCRQYDSSYCDDYLCSGGINPGWHASGRRKDYVTTCDDGLGRTVSGCLASNMPAAVPTPEPSTATPVPPATAVPNTATPAPPATAVPSTATPVPPTTAAPSTATPAPPATAVPSTASPAPPVTAVPSTATPVPPPVATPTPIDPAHTVCPQAVRVVSFQSASTFDQNAPLTFGGSFRVRARVLINSYTHYGRVFDFGNGAGSDNVLVTQHGRSGRLSMFVFVGTRAQHIICDTQAPVGRPFVMEASVLNGKAVIKMDGAVCAQGPVAAPLAVSRSENLIGQSHWSHDGPLDGEVTSFELDTCEA